MPDRVSLAGPYLAVSGWTPHPRTYDNTLHRGLAIVHGAHKALAIKAAKSRPARFVLRMKGRFLTTLAAEKGSRGGLQGAGAWQPGRTRTRYLDTLDRPSPRPPNRYLDTPSRVSRLYLVAQIPQSWLLLGSLPGRTAVCVTSSYPSSAACHPIGLT